MTKSQICVKREGLPSGHLEFAIMYAEIINRSGKQLASDSYSLKVYACVKEKCFPDFLPEL